MDRILLNQKTINSRRELKKIQKASMRGYCRGKSISKTKIGKLVRLATSQEMEKDTPSLSHEVSLDRLLELLGLYHLTGMSGNGFSIKTKLESFLQNQSPKYLLINGVECEPGLIHDEWILHNYWNEVSEGIQFMSQMIPFQRCVLACKMTKEERRIVKVAKGFEVCIIPARYPMGEEHLLVKQVFGKILQRKEHPVDAGILVMNVQSIYQIYCLLTEHYQNGRYVTLTDLDSGEARVTYATRGESIKEKLLECFPQNKSKNFFAGSGIMSAHEIKEEECFADQISFASIGYPAKISNDTACKGCGTCNRKCPSGVNVRKIVKLREADNQADISDLGIENCISCNSCTFFCKAGKNISEYLKS
jgi:Na+-translocating ferredoxin:NAD+ oxidoreductase RnfC subunit